MTSVFCEVVGCVKSSTALHTKRSREKTTAFYLGRPHTSQTVLSNALSLPQVPHLHLPSHDVPVMSVAGDGWLLAKCG